MNENYKNRKVPREVEGLSRLMDSKFSFPGTKFRFGVDPILSLIPGIGDVISFLISGSLIGIIARHGASRKLIILMTLNAFVDAVLGSIPVLGGILDFFYKANERNVRMLRKHYQQGKYQGSGKGVIITMVITILVLLALLIWAVWEIGEWLFAYLQQYF